MAVTEKKARETYYALEAVRRLEYDIYRQVDVHKHIPREWGKIAANHSQKREKVTIRLDADVLRFLRSMGPGYQARANDVLRAFMHSQLSGLMQGPESLQSYLEEVEAEPEARQNWGDMGRMMED